MTSAGCLLCKADLVYDGRESVRPCSVCGTPASSNARCKAGHFVCDRCHALGALDLIQRVCLTTESTCPGELAERIMKSAAFHMHGPEHHFLVPAVLIAAWANARELSQEERERLIAEARRRAEVVRGGFCGLWGACGAGVGTGIFASIVTGGTPLSKREWRLANALTSAALAQIAQNGGPRCCKRCVRLAIAVAVDIAKRELGVEFEQAPKAACGFSATNRECTRDECLYHAAPGG
jgi:Family of unknown function (DUF5714)